MPMIEEVLKPLLEKDSEEDIWMDKEDVAKMMTSGTDIYGHYIDNDNDIILDDYFASKNEEEE